MPTQMIDVLLTQTLPQSKKKKRNQKRTQIIHPVVEDSVFTLHHNFTLIAVFVWLRSKRDSFL
jgi:hypothetical protein